MSHDALDIRMFHSGAAACPRSYPYPVANSLHCCKYYRRKENGTTTSDVCDGFDLQPTDPLECCARDSYEGCDGIGTLTCVRHAVGESAVLLYVQTETIG